MIAYFVLGKRSLETTGEAGSPQRVLVGCARVRELSLQRQCALSG